MKNTKMSWFGLAFIVAGVLLLLQHMDVFHLQWSIVLWSAMALAGLRLGISGFQRSSRTKVFWGSQLLFLGMYQVFGTIGVIGSYWYFLAPSLFIMAGAGFFMMFLVRTTDWHLLVPAVVLGGFGAAMVFAEFGVMSRWQIMDVVNDYWPLALILFGGLMLLSQFLKNRKVQNPSDPPGQVA
jgi:hypothetical protein